MAFRIICRLYSD